MVQSSRGLLRAISERCHILWYDKKPKADVNDQFERAIKYLRDKLRQDRSSPVNTDPDRMPGRIKVTDRLWDPPTNDGRSLNGVNAHEGQRAQLIQSVLLYLDDEQLPDTYDGSKLNYRDNQRIGQPHLDCDRLNICLDPPFVTAICNKHGKESYQICYYNKKTNQMIIVDQ